MDHASSPWISSRTAAVILLGALLLAAGCSRSTQPLDGVRPAPIRDLKIAGVSDSSVTLTWTATGDDDRVGTASLYDLRRMASPITEQDWTSGIPIDSLSSPAPAGTRETFVVRALPEGRRQYFALKAADDAGLWSLISNLATAKPGSPHCSVSPESLAFGVTAVGSHFDLPMRITNTAGGTLAGEVVSSSPEFQILAGGGTFYLGADSIQRVVVRFAPSSSGPRSCTLQLGTGCGEVHCTGSGGELNLDLVQVVRDSTSFAMGSPSTEPGHEGDEGRHEVVLTVPYGVSTREIIQSEWFAVMGWNDARFVGADRPVENITWFDAIDFCNLLSERDGLSPAYGIQGIQKVGHHIISADVLWDWRAGGYRLLTEAEWECACRVWSTTAFSNGQITQEGCDDPLLGQTAWYCGNAGGRTQPVRTRQPNALQLFDLHGNVFEWCWDYYDPNYGQTLDAPGDPLHGQRNPIGPEEGEGRVIRGGSWQANAQQCRSAYRLFFRPGTYHDDVGLRVGRTVQ